MLLGSTLGLSGKKVAAMLNTVVALAFIAGAVCAAPTPSADYKAIEPAISAVKPALVRIFVATVDYYQGREMKSEASGSGVIISKDGYVVTNHHVAGWAKRLVCTLSNKEEVEADLIGTDPLTDIAVIKLRPNAAVKEFQPAVWGDSSKLRVGDPVLAMGSPLALSQSVTQGIISNTELVLPEIMGGGLKLDGEDVGALVRWIGHDARISPGNSGGPLVNLKGEIIGVNEISIGLSGAIPSNLARQIAESIIKQGKVSRAWIGANVQPLLKSSSVKNGVLVAGVVPKGPADEAGLQSGDIISKVAAKAVNVRFAEELPAFNQVIAALSIGADAEFTVLRDGKTTSLKIKPQEQPIAEPRPREMKQWGACASDLSLIKARSLKRNNSDGALIRSIGPGGPCADAKPPIEQSDVIVEVAGKPIKSLQDLVDVTAEVTEGKTEPTPVLVAFDRGQERLITVVKVGIREFEDPGREVRKAFLPVGMQVITRDIAEVLGIAGKMGVRLTQIYPNSSAEKAGLKVGDLIVALDGKSIPASQPQDTEVLPAMIRQYKIGSEAQLTIMRDGEEIAVPIAFEESPLLPREMKKFRDDNFEFTVRDLADRDRLKDNEEKPTEGVYVETVNQGGWAAFGLLATGDIITKVNNEPVSEVSGMREVMHRIAEQKPKHVVFHVKRGITQVFVELEADWSNK